MARSPFPTGNGFGNNTSDPLAGINIGAPAAGAAFALADATKRVGRQIGEMAERAWKREGEADAARVIAAEELTGNEAAFRAGRGTDDEAYNAVLREDRFAKRQAAYMEGAAEIDIAHPSNLATWSEANAANRAAFAPTGDAETDASFARWRTVFDAQRQGRVRQGQEAARVATGRATFVEAASVGRTALGQSVATAGFDEAGTTLVGVSLSQYATHLSRFGPREAFSIGGVEFAADPTRADVVSPEALAETFDTARRETQMLWISEAAERSPDAAAKRAFVGQVQERWAAGDPAFIGLDAGDFSRLNASLEAGVARSEADAAAAIRASADRARDLLKAGEYGDDVDMQELRSAAQQSGDPGLIAQVEFAAVHGFEATPASLRSAEAGAGAVGGGFAGASDFLLDTLEGSGFVANDGGRGRSQWGVTERSHPEAWRDGRVDRAEAVQVARGYWDAIGGDGLDPDLAVAALASAYVGGIETAKGFLREADGDLDQFMALEEARFRQLAGGDQQKLDGWLARQGRVRAMVGRQRAQRRSQEGYSSDPIGFARGNRTRQPMATVTEFDPAAGFLSGTAGQGFGQALRQRRALGQALSQRDGVPARMLDDEEARFYRDRIAAEPGAIIPLAANVATSLGGDGSRQFFAELGRQGMAGADLHLAYLATDRDHHLFVSNVIEGRRLRAEGAKPPVWTGDDPTLDQALRTMAPAFQNQPDLTAAIRSLAEDRAIADVARGEQRDASYYLNLASGALNVGGHMHGGVTELNGRQTLLPSWMRADMADEALEWASVMFTRNAIGPVYDNGSPIPANMLRRYQLRAQADGSYQLLDPRSGRPAMGRNGRAFRFDVEQEAFRTGLRRALPDAFAPGT